ncbi:hypothetical protein GCM10009872_50590 [Actinopolymorpha rutila]
MRMSGYRGPPTVAHSHAADPWDVIFACPNDPPIGGKSVSVPPGPRVRHCDVDHTTEGRNGPMPLPKVPYLAGPGRAHAPIPQYVDHMARVLAGEVARLWGADLREREHDAPGLMLLEWSPRRIGVKIT